VEALSENDFSNVVCQWTSMAGRARTAGPQFRLSPRSGTDPRLLSDGMTYGDLDVAEEYAWAMAEARKEAVAVAPGWFRAWPTGDERWSALNIRAATQVIVNHSREDDRHPNSWTVRALFGDKAVELRAGPYDSKAQAILVAHAVLSLAFGPAHGTG